MKNTIYYSSLCFIFLILLAFTTHKNTEQHINHLVEKIYAQTDRPFYFPGEKIWFKAYLTNANEQANYLSDMAYVELLSPKGTLVKKLVLEIKEGAFYGDFEIAEEDAGGIYTLKIYTKWMQNFGKTSFFEKKLTVQKVVQPNLLLRLKMEKEAYGVGSKVLANYEVKDLENNPLVNATIEAVLQVDGQVIKSKTFTSDAAGKAILSFKLPNNLNSTNVIINAITLHKNNREAISRSVPVILNNIDLHFFPEGGFAHVDVDNKIAFKAINEYGKPADISGKITDEHGQLITKFSSLHNGIGSFNLHPNANTKYYATITQPFLAKTPIELPPIKEKFIQFSLQNKTDNEQEKIMNIYSFEEKELLVQISNVSEILYEKKLTVQAGNNELIINTAAFPIGITQFAILNTEQQILGKRLAFLHKNRQLNIDIELEKEQFDTRELVTVKLKTSDKEGKAIPANLSLSVADNKLLSLADDKQANILANLLIGSELQGKIHEPNYYFKTFTQAEKIAKQTAALDNVMLTHGYKNYLDSLNNYIKTAPYLAEKIDLQTGTIVDKNGNAITAKLLIFENRSDKAHKATTDEYGNFALRLNNGKRYTILAYRDDEKALNINLDKIKTNNTRVNRRNRDKNKKRNKNKEKPTQNTPLKMDKKLPINGSIKQAANTLVMEEEELNLERVVVRGSKMEVQLMENKISLSEVVVSSAGVNPSYQNVGYAINSTQNGPSLNNKSQITNLLRGNITGLEITNSAGIAGTQNYLSIRGTSHLNGTRASEPLIVIDGIPYENQHHLNNYFANILPHQINSVSVVQGIAATTLYGANANNGVIIVNTESEANYISNNNSKSIPQKKFKNYTAATIYPSYHRKNLDLPERFQIPVYNQQNPSPLRTDFRNTIYWNPVIQTDENGYAEFNFYTSDAITAFKITSEGVGYNGLIGRKEVDFSTQKLLSVNCKIPNYLSLNDTVILPITVSNESKQNLSGQLHISLPPQIQLLEETNTEKNTIEIAANSFATKKIKIIPIQKGKNLNIKAYIKTPNHKDVFQQPIEIISPYFPIETSLAGNQNKTFSFPINHAIPNSLNANLNIYVDIVGEVMDGVEGLLRAPYGCFEQTSSSTYPNILVLQYLNETGKSNPEIAAKAMDYIEKGYKRLISFESNGGGFEWFGKTPAHETLTAYGLLEFTEMKAVYPKVDDKMIKRTAKWLLSRKDGKGGFKKSKKGYDSFASSPQNVANAYIVYALSQTGYANDLSKEYETAFKEALKSKDVYRMAIMACASYNLKNSTNAEQLISEITNKINEVGVANVASENTITRSYGNAKSIESIAWACLALMKENQSETLLQQCIEHILAQRNNGRFGSTQSTVMALKALIAYTQMQKNRIISESDLVVLNINGQEIKQSLQVQQNGKISIPNIEQYFTTGPQTVQVGFSNPEVMLPYNLNLQWDSSLPNSSADCLLAFQQTLAQQSCKVGDNVNLQVQVQNKTKDGLGMAIALVGIPSGTSAQAWQLKELLEKEQFAFYEIFGNYLVFYWRSMAPSETKTINLALKAEIPGRYTAPASSAYLYYGDEHKHWVRGEMIGIE